MRVVGIRKTRNTNSTALNAGEQLGNAGIVAQDPTFVNAANFLRRIDAAEDRRNFIQEIWIRGQTSLVSINCCVALRASCVFASFDKSARRNICRCATFGPRSADSYDNSAKINADNFRRHCGHTLLGRFVRLASLRALKKFVKREPHSLPINPPITSIR